MASYLIALPAYNEIESIGEMIQRIRSIGREVIVVDNASTDGTADAARVLGVEVYQRGEYGSGYGAALRKAMDVAFEKGYTHLAFLDCDGTYPPEAFPELEKYIDDYDMVVGARPMRSIDPVRRLGNYAHTWACRLLYARRIDDVNSGMRIVRIDRFRGYTDAPHFGMIPQMASMAYRNGFKVIEIPIRYDERMGESKLRMSDGWIILRALIRERFKSKRSVEPTTIP